MANSNFFLFFQPEDKLDAMFHILNAFCSIQTEKNLKGANRFLNIFLLEFNHSGQIASVLLQVNEPSSKQLFHLILSNDQPTFLVS